MSMRYIINTWAVTIRFGRDELTLHCSPEQLEDLCIEWQKAARAAAETKEFNGRKEAPSG